MLLIMGYSRINLVKSTLIPISHHTILIKQPSILKVYIQKHLPF